MTGPWTIKKILDWTQDYFYKKEIDSARLDAELLLSHVLQIKRLDLYLQFDRVLAPKELSAYKALIQRRVEHEPVATILGEKEFWSLTFKVTRDVLIPRPDTEVLVEQVLKKIGGAVHGFEIGIGSGAIAIALLKEVSFLQMEAVEISKAAVLLSQENARTHGVEDRLKIMVKDFLNDFSCVRKFDFIVSNPPYVSEEDFVKLPQTIKNFEPRLALVAADKGLAFYKVIAQKSHEWLKENGFVAVEIGETQGEAVKNIFLKNNLQDIKIIKDYVGLDRVVIGVV